MYLCFIIKTAPQFRPLFVQQVVLFVELHYIIIIILTINRVTTD